MRVITGTAKGRRLEAPAGDTTRPTGAKVKEAVFSMIQFELEGARVLDLFAGSGQMGIEALSRGAQSCVFVDSGRAAQKVLRQNLEATGLIGQSRLVGSDVLGYLATATRVVDIVFLDPPYKEGLVPSVLDRLSGLVSEGGAVICETARDQELTPQAGELVLQRAYHYGKTSITVYRKESSGNE